MTKTVVSDQLSVVSTQVRMIAIGDLREASWNARKTVDPVALKSLRESIAQHGVQVPLIVRPLPETSWKLAGDAEAIQGGYHLYEIVAGHRRFMAADGLTELPCIVRELDDVAAREIGLVDNLQREDVPALEEADAYKELLNGTTGPAAIAARVGKDVAYVTKRLQLVSLGELQRKALAERLITVDHALLLARLGQDEQDANLKWCLDSNAGVKKPLEEVIEDRIKRLASKERWRWEAATPQRLKEHIEQGVDRKLSRAPWDLADAKLLPEAGACDACPSNTKANTLLFDDLAIQAATCVDGHCFERKRAAFVQIKLATIPKQTVRVEAPAGSALNPVDRYVFPLRVSHKSTTVEPRAQRNGDVDRDGFNPSQVFRYGQWIDAKKGSCEFVRQAVTVDWDEPGWGSGKKLKKPGQVIDVCIAAKCKVHRKSWEKQANGGDSDAARQKALAEQAEKNRQLEIEEAKMRVAVASAAIEGVVKLPLEAIRVAAIDALPRWEEGLRPYNALLPGLRKILTEAKADSVQFAKAVAIAFLPERALTPARDWINAEGRAAFMAGMKRLGYTGPNPWAKPDKPKAEKLPAKKAAKAPAKKAAKKAAKKGGRK